MINNKFLVEIKPKHLWKSDIVIRKKYAAEIWCKEYNFIYKLSECVKQISFEEIKQLIEEKKLIFMKKYQEKFNNYVKK
ncbi:hypothetical protein M0Q50_10590 [bacterium]|jgi:hypothetical protein|nr:hypothetical protein [bacterium]